MRSHPKILNLDMDGVLADTISGARTLQGLTDQDPFEMQWDLIYTKPDFFATLPVLPWASVLVARALEWRFMGPSRSVRILTAASVNHFASVARQKRTWWDAFKIAHSHLPGIEGVTLVACPGSATKHLFLENPGDILVDDFHRNVKRWASVGGHAIHLSPNKERQIISSLVPSSDTFQTKETLECL